MLRHSAGVALLVAFSVLGTLASSTPGAEVQACLTTDKNCIEPVHGLPVEAYLMNADNAWAAASPFLGNASATAHASSNTSASAFGQDVDAQATADAATREEPNLAAQDGRTHAVPCASPTACADLTPDGLVLLKDIVLQRRLMSANDCNVAEGNTQPGLRWHLRFTTTSPNQGDGPVHLGSPIGSPLFEWGVCHKHFHFTSYGEYRLWTRDGYTLWRQLRADNPDAIGAEVLAAHPELASEYLVGHKQGFCIIDVTNYKRVNPNPSHYINCGHQGITPGWADTYTWGLDGQFIDVTGVPAGHYVLEIEVNTERVIEESAYGNNFAAVEIVLPPQVI